MLHCTLCVQKKTSFIHNLQFIFYEALFCFISIRIKRHPVLHCVFNRAMKGRMYLVWYQISTVFLRNLLLQRFNPYLQYLSVPLEGAEVSRPKEQRKESPLIVYNKDMDHVFLYSVWKRLFSKFSHFSLYFSNVTNVKAVITLWGALQRIRLLSLVLFFLLCQLTLIPFFRKEREMSF